MNKIAYKVSVAVSTVTLLFGSFTTSLFAEDLTISGNGNKSTNTIIYNNTSDCKVEQETNTLVLASVSATSSTGGNKISGNTGAGDKTIDTGSATSTASLTVSGGNNSMSNPCCCQPNSETNGSSVDISGNGKKSTNKVTVDKSTSSTIEQESFTGVFAKVKAKSRTGRNKVKDNTGAGNVGVTTNSAESTSTLDVKGGTNTL